MSKANEGNRLIKIDDIKRFPPSADLFHVVIPKAGEHDLDWKCNWIRPGSACVTNGHVVYFAIADRPKDSNSFQKSSQFVGRSLEKFHNSDGTMANHTMSQRLCICKYDSSLFEFVGYWKHDIFILDENAMKPWIAQSFHTNRLRGGYNDINCPPKLDKIMAFVPNDCSSGQTSNSVKDHVYTNAMFYLHDDAKSEELKNAVQEDGKTPKFVRINLTRFEDVWSADLFIKFQQDSVGENQSQNIGWLMESYFSKEPELIAAE